MPVLEGLGSSLRSLMDKITRQPDLNEKLVGEIVNELEKALIRADVNIYNVKALGEEVRKRLLEEEPPSGVPRRDYAVKVIYDQLVALLGGERSQLSWPEKDRLHVVLLVGLQGSGKTTTAAKIASFYMRRGYRAGLVAADTHRPGAKEQLIQLGAKIGAPVYSRGDKPDEIARAGVEELRKAGCNIVIVDTAGRHKEEKSLLDEMAQIQTKLKPDEVYLVVDATIGQQAKAQAEAFSKVAKVGSIAVTKLDGSAKGGGALSAAAATGARIRFIGVGEGIDDLEAFEPRSFISRLLGMGDLQSLLEKVKEAQISEKQMQEIVTTGRFTLVDFEYYLESMSKMGPLSKVLTMLPGVASLPSEVTKGAEDDLKKFRVILKSMTRKEKVDPSLINASRIRRIAIGSGRRPEEVRMLIKRYELMRNQMKQLKRNRAMLRKLGVFGAQ
ncbi:MAG: signal recognition particle receptor subunit alpha [Candidatus Marsarchaeota archaeon]|nr:signal recognition particle receptor subunit alpha [Candidatus Marsarchaeota archaeon]